MATTASFAAIRALRRTEEIGASKAVVEVVAQLFVLFGLGVTGMLMVAFARAGFDRCLEYLCSPKSGRFCGLKPRMSTAIELGCGRP
jgi:hypothetical protein